MCIIIFCKIISFCLNIFIRYYDKSNKKEKMILSGWDSQSPQKQNKAQICYRNKVPKQKKQGLTEGAEVLANSINLIRIRKQQTPTIRNKKIGSTIQSKKSSIQKVTQKEKYINFNQHTKIQPLSQWQSQNIQQRTSSNIERLKKQVEFLEQQSKLQSLRLKTSQDFQLRSTITQPNQILSFLNQKKISSLKNPRRIKKGRPQIVISGKKSIIQTYKKQNKPDKGKIILTQLKQNNKCGIINEILSKWNAKDQKDKNRYRNLKNNPTIVLRHSLATIG